MVQRIYILIAAGVLGLCSVGSAEPVSGIPSAASVQSVGATNAGAGGMGKSTGKTLDNAPAKPTAKSAEATVDGAAGPAAGSATPNSGLIVRRGETTPAAGGTDKPAATNSSQAANSALRVVGALVVVLGVILGLKYGAGKFLGVKSAGPKSNKGVRVLSRTMMGHKQQLILLQVGRKLVLVSDSGGKVSTVTEITDPDEVAELAGQALGRSSEGLEGTNTNVENLPRSNRSFAPYVKRQSSSYQETREEDEDDTGAELQDADQSREGNREDSVDLSGLAERVRKISRQFK